MSDLTDQSAEPRTYDCPNCGTVYPDSNGNGRACSAATPHARTEGEPQ